MITEVRAVLKSPKTISEIDELIEKIILED